MQRILGPGCRADSIKAWLPRACSPRRGYRQLAHAPLAAVVCGWLAPAVFAGQGPGVGHVDAIFRPYLGGAHGDWTRIHFADVNNDDILEPVASDWQNLGPVYPHNSATVHYRAFIDAGYRADLITGVVVDAVSNDGVLYNTGGLHADSVINAGLLQLAPGSLTITNGGSLTNTGQIVLEGGSLALSTGASWNNAQTARGYGFIGSGGVTNDGTIETDVAAQSLFLSSVTVGNA